MTKQLEASPEKRKRKSTRKAPLRVFKKQLAKLVQEAGSQRALAMRTGVSQAVISKWLAGSSPEAPMLINFALGAGVSFDWLLLDEGPRERRASTGAPLETQLGAYLRARLSQYQRQVEGVSSAPLSEAFAHRHDWEIGRATLVRLEELLVPEFVAVDQHFIRFWHTRELMFILNEHWRKIPRALGKPMLANLEESIKPVPAAAALFDALNGAALERVAAEQDRLKRSAPKQGQ